MADLGDEGLDEFCRAHPAFADGLRASVAELRRLGFLDGGAFHAGDADLARSLRLRLLLAWLSESRREAADPTRDA
jgi:hypothetical protein